MKKYLYILYVISIILLIIFTNTFSIYAANQSDLNAVNDKINETEEEIKRVESTLSETMLEIQELEGEIDAVKYELEKVQAELTTLTNEVNQLQKELEENEADYNVKLENACTRVVAQYKYGKVTFLDVLLNSDSLSSFLSNYYRIEQILASDQEYLEELQREKEKIEADKLVLEEKKAEVETRKEEIETQKVILTNKMNEKNNKVASLNAEDAALQQQKEEYYAEKAKIEEEIRKLAAQAGTGGGSYSGGSLAFPCPGYTRVSSYFGSRGAPLAGGSSYHRGVDLAAPQGTSILAAESGTVITVSNSCTHNYGKSRSCGCGGGYGNYLMVNHGNGLVTVYAHCTTIYAKLGQKVSRGEVIATVGTTGASTGNHLHFGVLLNGTYVDPAPYIGL